MSLLKLASYVGSHFPDDEETWQDLSVLEAPLKCLAMIRLGPNAAPLGTVASDDTVEKDKARVENKTDQVIVRLELYSRPQWISSITISFIIHYHDEENNYCDSKVLAIFDYHNINIRERIVCQPVHELTEQEHKQLSRHWSIDFETEPYKSLIDEQRLCSFRFSLAKPAKGQNLFSDNKFGVFEEQFSQLRTWLSHDPTNIRLVSLLVRAGDITEIVNPLNTNIIKAFNHDPVRDWFAPRNHNLDNIVLGGGDVLKERPFFYVPPMITFPNLTYYSVVMGYGSQQECEGQQKNTSGIGPFDAVLIGLRDDNNNRMLAIFDWLKQDDGLTLNPGEQLKVTFKDFDDDPEAKWHGQVTDNLQFCTMDQAAIWITRPRDPENSAQFIAFNPEITANITLKDFNVPIAELKDLIAKATPQSIKLTPTNDQKELKRRWKTINALALRRRDTDKNRFQTQSQVYETLIKTLCATNISALPKSDLFDSEKISNPETFKRAIKSFLTPAQSKLVDACSNAPGRMVLVEGPPGTGKTFAAFHVAAMVAWTGKALITTSVNGIADKSYVSINKIIHQQRSKFKFTKRLVVIRVHSTAAEKDILLQKANEKRPQLKAVALGPMEVEDLSHIRLAQRIIERHNKEFIPKFSQVFDKRVTDLESSLGWHMSRVAGIIKDENGNLYYGAKPKEFQKFRQYYDDYFIGKKFSPEDDTDFISLINDLRKEVFAQANVVITTLSNTSIAKIWMNFQPDVVVIDEAAKVCEPDALHASVYYPNARCIIQVGDSVQLLPTVLTPASENGFAPNLKTSQYVRLRLAGIPTVELTVQQRYCEEINELVSKVFYANTITTGSNIDVAQVDRVSKIHNELYKLPNNAVWVCVKSEDARWQSNPTLFNPVEVVAVMDLIGHYLEKGLKPEEIGVITPYHGQYMLLNRAKGVLSDHLEISLENLLVAKFDQVAGDERPLVIISMTATAKAGFLSIPNRMNSAVSRAKYGLVIVGDYNRIKGFQRIRRMKLGEVLNWFNHRRFDMEVTTPDYLQDILPVVTPRKRFGR